MFMGSSLGNYFDGEIVGLLQVHRVYHSKG